MDHRTLAMDFLATITVRNQVTQLLKVQGNTVLKLYQVLRRTTLQMTWQVVKQHQDLQRQLHKKCRASCDLSTVLKQQGPSTTTGYCLDPADIVLPTTAWGHRRVPMRDLRNFSFTKIRLSPGTPSCSAKILHLEDKGEITDDGICFQQEG